MSKIITPAFGGVTTLPPTAPPTYEELVGQLVEQKAISATLRGALLARDEDIKLLAEVCELATIHLEELIKLQDVNTAVAKQSAINFKRFADLLAPKV